MQTKTILCSKYQLASKVLHFIMLKKKINKSDDNKTRIHGVCRV